MTPITAVHTVPGAWLPLTESWLYHQIRHLPATVESHVLCERTENLDQFPLEHVHCLSAAPRWRRRVDRGLRRLRLRRASGYLADRARRLRPHVVHSHFGPTGWTHRRVARRLGAGHVVTFYGLDVGYLPRSYPAWRDRYHGLFRDVDRVLCEGAHMAKSIAELGCPADKIRVHHLGVEVDRIAYRPLDWAPAEPLRVLIAASFREKKGIPIAIDALGRVHLHHPIEVTIIGDAGDDPRSQREKAAILSAIDRSGLAERVTLRGYQPHSTLLAEAERHHLFLAPSITAADGDTEGGAPVVLLEMMAAGTLIVSTRHCDIPGMIEDGVTGRLVDERDVPGLAEAMLELAAHPETWADLRHAARRCVETRFDACTQGQRLAELYLELKEAA